MGIATEERDYADSVRVTQRLRMLHERITQTGHGEGGAYGLAASPEALQALADHTSSSALYRDELTSDLSPRQKEAFTLASDRVLDDLQKENTLRAAGHRRELGAAELVNLENAVADRIRQGEYAGLGAFTLPLELEGPIRAQHGFGEVGNQKVLEARARLREVVLESMLGARMHDEAEKYLAEYRPDLDQKGAAYEARVQEARREQDMDQRALTLVQDHREGPDGFVNVEAARRAADEVVAKLGRAEDRDTFRAKLQSYLADQEELRVATAKPVWNRIYAAFNQRKRATDVDANDLVRLNQIDPTMRGRMDKILGKKPGGPTVPSLSKDALRRFREDLVQNEELYLSGGYDLDALTHGWRHQMNEKDFDRAFGFLMKAKQAREKAGRVGWEEFGRRAATYAENNGIGKRTGRMRRSRDAWMADVQSEYIMWLDDPKNAGKTPDRETVTQWFDAYNPAMEYPTGEEGIFGPKKAPLAELPRDKQLSVLYGGSEAGPPPVGPRPAPPAPRPAAVPTAVPASDRQAIIEALTTKRRPVTEAAILELYNAAQAKARASQPIPAATVAPAGPTSSVTPASFTPREQLERLDPKDPSYYVQREVLLKAQETVDRAAAAREGEEAKRRAAAARPVRNRKQAVAKLDAMGVQDQAERDRLLREWGY